jgi:hypothetical protein
MHRGAEEKFFKGRSLNSQKSHEGMLKILGIKKIQLKNSLRFHHSPVRMANIKNTNKNIYW